MKRTIIAKWIPHLEMYRLYDPSRPNHTIAYENDRVGILRRIAEERGEAEITFDCSELTEGNESEGASE